MSQLSNISENGAQPSSATGDSTKESGNDTSQENKENAVGEQSEPATQGRVIIRERVVTKEQIGAFEDLGLGRGVDATNPTPWLNKSAFQVRHVTYDNIIGTEEGNLYQGFVNEVESTQNLQTSLKASIPLNQQVNLGIDSELSRSYSSTQKSVGRKIITRTIAFRANSDDTSEISSDQGMKVEKDHQGENHDTSGHNQDSMEENGKKKLSENHEKKEIQKKGQTFEDHLKAWINQRIQDDKKIKEIELEETDKDRETQAEESGNLPKSFDDCTVKQLSGLCYKFVRTFSITHYVHSLELGASHYRVMSEEEYSMNIRSKGSLGVAQMADIAIGAENSKKLTKRQRRTTKIGRMKLHHSEDSKDHVIDESKSTPKQEDGATISLEEEVRRGSIEEAVVGVKVQPISTLVVKHVKLRRALQDALQLFIQNRQKVKYGPFFICCNRESTFLSVSDSRQIEATEDIEHASKFYIVRCDEGDDHFFIVHEAPTSLHNENVTKFEKMPPVPMYLKASMNWRRRSTPTKPLMMEMNVNSRLSIHSRRDKEFHPAKLTEWVSQKEVFFIRCEEQARLLNYCKSSYLCVYQPKGEASYVTGCKPDIRSDDSNRFMLFRLVKLNEDEVATCTATTSIVPFIIKFEAKGDARFFEVSKDCKEVNTTKKKSEASTFHLKVEKCNYFRILYKTKDHVYYLHAPTKLVTTTSHQPILSLSLTEDARARSYMAFYNASDTPSRSRRLHQRELSDLIESSTEDKLHITCQRSMDSDSRDASDLYVKQNEKRNSIRVKVKHGITKEDKEPDKVMHFTKFVLLNPIAPFIIKFREAGKDLFFEVSSDCKEVCTTEKKSKASTFHLKAEKSNYFKILYKTKGDQVYLLHAPATSSKLSLSLMEDASARSYMAFYNASDTPFHSRRLQLRELSDLIDSSTEDKLHITCQRSVDSNSRDASDFYVEQKESTFHVQVKHGKTKHPEEKHKAEASSTPHLTGFVLQCSTNMDTCTEQPSSTDSTQTQHSLTGTDSQTGADSKTPSRENSKQNLISHSLTTVVEPETLSLSTACMSSNTPLAKDSKQISSSANQAPTDMTHGIEECVSEKVQHLSNSEDPKTLSVAKTSHSSNIGTDVDTKILPPTEIHQLSPSTSKSSVSASDPPSTQNSEKILPQSADKGSKTPSTKQLSSSDVPSSKPHSEEDSKQAKLSVGKDSETRDSKPAEHSRIMTASSSPLPTPGSAKPQTPPRQKPSPQNTRANHSRGFFDRCSVM